MDVTYRLLAFNELSLEQLYRILALRAEVFVVEQDCVYQDLDGLDQEAYHLLQLDGHQQLVGYTRLIAKGNDFEDACAIGRVITAPSVRRQGLGRPLMRESIRHCERLWSGVPIKLHAQVYLLDFYATFGFEPYGDQFLEDGLPHQHMVRLSATS